jgi:putative tryptophan/tyrosine transport system substrate-binding protein
VRRREFITLLGGAAVGWSLATSAQTQPKIPRVGCVFVSNPTSNKHLSEAFRQALRELGYVEGQTIVLELPWAEGRFALHSLALFKSTLDGLLHERQQSINSA